MTVATEQALAVTDAGGRAIGAFHVEEVRDALVLGTFTRGPDYPHVADVFAEFEEIAEGPTMSLFDQAFATIAALGIRVAVDGGEPAAVNDVQIWSDGNASFRLPPSAERNGLHPAG